ncbi:MULTISPECIES: spore maturation protein [Oceanobacillus]|uniref:Spore maturation protein B n=1 Tax=Oceanobacillus kimchii TaxID=746691 RepID=A0ABQ5TL83_9BACI|nr:MULTISPECIES: spore maturation protein [Oceanobacillus]MBT2598424.1 spore maturation protein [Oceanobacillus sp. ISL-74]MBT2651342.1 spore maturation protein [Oceanobacillus sp. ISL-73]MCT1576001.1 spore maturation protein [Oceanobacillus kimchii]MCT2135638.1 spore maturation protein [Oceanobacillus kimchii]OEH55738.1 spore maturation protein [Oceanobacillus sp. E9]
MEIITSISIWIIPCFILVILLMAAVRKIPAYDLFVEGGKEGVKTAFSLLPFLVGMIVAISILRSSGAMEAFVQLISPILSIFGIPSEVLPLALIRPISGTAALGMTTELISTYGPDSFIGRIASVMQGSTDTTLYIITVYFGAVGIKKIRYALKVGLLADLIAILSTIVLVKIMFG